MDMENKETEWKALYDISKKWMGVAERVSEYG